MTVLVAYCNHWIGFHIVNELLGNDYEVDGLVDDSENENLSMFFGRNSSFSFVHGEERKTYRTAIIIGGEEKAKNIQADRYVIIGGNPRKGDAAKSKMTIQMPLLFGEWMPMNEKGFYRNNELITFDSEAFHLQAIYISDFTKGLLQWLKTIYLPQFLDVRSAKEKKNKDIKLENTVFIRDNVPIHTKAKLVQDHYLKYKAMY